MDAQQFFARKHHKEVINDLFHQCWAQAQTSPDYDKAKWTALQIELWQIQVKV